MALLSAADLAGMQQTYADEFTQDAAQGTLYDTDGVSHPRPFPVRLWTDKSLDTMRVAGAFYKIRVPATIVLAGGEVFSVTMQNNPLSGANLQWFMVREVGKTPGWVNITTTAQALALPYALSVTRYTTGQTQSALNWNDEPYVDGQGTPIAPVTHPLVRCGFMNDFNPETMQAEGQEPGSIVTWYCPLGADIQKDDRLTLPDGRPVIVQQINMMAANGAIIGKTLIFNEEG